MMRLVIAFLLFWVLYPPTRSLKLDFTIFPFELVGLKAESLDFNDTHVTIENLHYTGIGPDTFFVVGVCPDKFYVERPDPRLRVTKLTDENGSFDVLKEYKGKTITLSLLSGKSWKDYDYFAIYCIEYYHVFGYVKIDHNKLYPGSPSVANLSETRCSNSSSLNEISGEPSTGSQASFPIVPNNPSTFVFITILVIVAMVRF